jgi:hypothetical protein
MPFHKNRAQQVVVHTKCQTSSAQPGAHKTPDVFCAAFIFQISVVLVVATSDDICLACCLSMFCIDCLLFTTRTSLAHKSSSAKKKKKKKKNILKQTTTY